MLTPKPEILIATGNPGKIREIREALCSLPIKLRYLTDFPNVCPVAEVGQTYEENALLKALGYSSQTGLCALADDSGLEVDALGGKPGVLSARFGGAHLSDAERVEKLLRELSRFPDAPRTARFVCSMVLVGWRNRERLVDAIDPRLLGTTEGTCEGTITTIARGGNGFGFDPVFIPIGYEKTFAELSDEVKAEMSHRSRALAAMSTFIDRWVYQT